MGSRFFFFCLFFGGFSDFSVSFKSCMVFFGVLFDCFDVLLNSFWSNLGF